MLIKKLSIMAKYSNSKKQTIAHIPMYGRETCCDYDPSGSLELELSCDLEVDMEGITESYPSKKAKSSASSLWCSKELVFQLLATNSYSSSSGQVWSALEGISTLSPCDLPPLPSLVALSHVRTLWPGW